jgi:hypothetical protein
MKISLLFFILGIILIFVGYSHQLKPTCNPNSNIEFINEDTFNTMVKNNASKIFNQMNHKDTFLGNGE